MSGGRGGDGVLHTAACCWSVGGAWAERTPAEGVVAAVYCILQPVIGQWARRRQQ